MAEGGGGGISAVCVSAKKVARLSAAVQGVVELLGQGEPGVLNSTLVWENRETLNPIQISVANKLHFVIKGENLVRM